MAASRAIFVFPNAAGHLNPSLPLARGLVSLGWEVNYIATLNFKEAIEDTGSLFFDRADDDGAAQATYRAAVRAAVRRVFSEGHFAARAQQISAGLERAEGVAGALRILQAASGAPRQTGID